MMFIHPHTQVRVVAHHVRWNRVGVERDQVKKCASCTMSRCAEFSAAEDETFSKLKSWAELSDGGRKDWSTKRDTSISTRFCEAWCVE